MPLVRTRRRLYWTCQVLGWAIFNGLFVVVGLASGGLPSVGAGRMTLFLASGWAFNIAATHTLHHLSSRRGWPERTLAGLLGRVVPTVIALGFAVSMLGNVAAAASDLVFGPLAPEAPSPVQTDVVMVSGAAFSAVLYGAWAVVYYLAVYAFRFRDAERDRLVLRASLAEARLQALDHQLNPHFLFNALNSIRALVLDEPHEARRAVTLLSSLLRQTLQAGREATHSLASELDLVRPYLDLEAIRFGDRLCVAWDIAPEAAGAEVPSLLLLTLVENAAKHGIGRVESGGEIRVSARASGGTLSLEVTNPVATPSSTPEAAGGTGTGLANARERLALLYGTDADLSLSHDADRVTARARLPFRSDA